MEISLFSPIHSDKNASFTIEYFAHSQLASNAHDLDEKNNYAVHLRKQDKWPVQVLGAKDSPIKNASR